MGEIDCKSFMTIYLKFKGGKRWFYDQALFSSLKLFKAFKMFDKTH